MARSAFDTIEFVAAVHARMAQERVSARTLAQLTGVNPSALGLILRGENGPSLPTAAALAVWGGLSLDRFLLDPERSPILWQGAD